MNLRCMQMLHIFAEEQSFSLWRWSLCVHRFQKRAFFFIIFNHRLQVSSQEMIIFFMDSSFENDFSNFILLANLKKCVCAVQAIYECFKETCFQSKLRCELLWTSSHCQSLPFISKRLRRNIWREHKLFLQKNHHLSSFRETIFLHDCFMKCSFFFID